MNSEEAEDLTECWECGATVSPSGDPVFAFDEDGVLCFECSLRRGGKYSDQDRWLRAPDVADLAGERQA